MNPRKPIPDKHVQVILDLLQRTYAPSHPKARVDAYRYNSACIRVRIVDPLFRKLPVRRREKIAWEHLAPLPDETHGQISLLVLLTPEEVDSSGVNYEFEFPEPPPGPRIHWTKWTPLEPDEQPWSHNSDDLTPRNSHSKQQRSKSTPSRS